MSVRLRPSVPLNFKAKSYSFNIIHINIIPSTLPVCKPGNTLLATGALLLGLITSGVHADPLDIVSYAGYANAQSFHLSGRIIEKRNHSAADVDSHWWQNLWHKIKRLVNDEQGDINVELIAAKGKYHATSDEEGYFSFNVATPAGLHPGWNTVNLKAEHAQTSSEVFFASGENCLGIISDFDDTVIVSNVTDKDQLLKNSLLKNYKQRQAVPGMPAFYRQLLTTNQNADNAALVFISASPSQLYKDIEAFLEFQQFPKHILITKQITGDQHDPLVNQKKYKMEKIREIFNAFQSMDFVLVGDDGENDPESYAAIQQQYPERVKAVWIRNVTNDPKRKRYPAQQLFDEAPGTSGTKETSKYIACGAS